jgi:hypothetical protein
MEGIAMDLKLNRLTSSRQLMTVSSSFWMALVSLQDGLLQWMM